MMQEWQKQMLQYLIILLFISLAYPFSIILNNRIVQLVFDFSQ